MVDDDRIVLRIEGYDYSGWVSASISAGIERLSREFAAELRMKEPIDGPLAAVCPGLPCDVMVRSEDGTEERVVAGWVEDYDLDGSADSVSLSIAGRSRTCDAVDSSVLPEFGVVRNRDLVAIVRTLLDPWGIEVWSIDADGIRVPKFRPDDGETVGSAIGRLCEVYGLLAFDDGDGDVLVVRGGSWDRSTDRIVRGPDGNVISGSIHYSTRERYTYYDCRGQVAGSDDVYGVSAAHPQAVVRDSEDVVGRSRVLVIDPERGADSDRCRRRAEHEASYREGRSITAEYVLRGWRDSFGEIWRPGTEIEVSDPLGHLERVMLIEEIALSVGATDGPRTKLSLVDPRAFDVIEPIKRKRWIRKRVKSDGTIELATKGESGLWAELETFAASRTARSTSATSYVPEGD